MGLSTVWVICSIFMIGVNCELNQPWVDIAARCSNMVRAFVPLLYYPQNEVTRYLVSPMATHCRLRHHYRNLLIPDVHLPRDRPTDVT